jgi:hypothetical protein
MKPQQQPPCRGFTVVGEQPRQNAENTEIGLGSPPRRSEKRRKSAENLIQGARLADRFSGWFAGRMGGLGVVQLIKSR